MEMQTVFAFWLVSTLFVVTPGADWAYAMSAGIRHRSVAPAVGGLLSGHLLVVGLVAAGVGALLAAHPWALTTLTAAGCAYLVWLGVGTIARPAVPSLGSAAGASLSGTGVSRQVLKGAGISGLNPKVFLLFVALLPQFTDAAAAWPVAGQIGALGAVHLVSCAAVYASVGLAARRVLGARPTAARMVSRLSGAAMVAIGVILLVERVAAV
ncbi:threonine/homoserine/homoserine lactone efflux protein [Zhihengliuella halotolerans]|uniref:Threonine/homoserine/homoserine lactone efflux protein n=2 Tax=Zhihengliuella halotolerans TaxID=370736 RepID=A0A4Q8AG54_9MICC|nr:threonine/homoserine/homoserine lactone efflux protein [Zhihengliuella halotolerans]